MFKAKKTAVLMKRQRKHTKCWLRFFLALSLVLIAGCTPSADDQLESAKELARKGQAREAIESLEKIMLRTPDSRAGVEAAAEAGRISFYDLQEFEKALKYYKHVVLYSQSPDARVLAQKQIVLLQFDHLANYPESVVEINRLLSMPIELELRKELKMKAARSYFYQNNLPQAENEADEFIRAPHPEDSKFEMKILKGNILVGQKKIPQAIELFQQLMKESPELSMKNNVGVTLSVCYEELKDFKSAISTLEQIRDKHPVPEYIDVRVSRLKERLKNQPGARGMRK